MKKSNVYKYYYFLASIDILTIIATLSLAYAIQVVYEKTFSENKQWIEQVNAFDKAIDLTITANGPGNDVFQSLAIEEEKKKFEKTYNDLNLQLKVIKENVIRIDSNNLLLGERVKNIQQNLLKGKQATFNIFHYLSIKDVTKASEFMSEMDGHFHSSLVSLSSIRSDIEKLQNAALNSNHEKATSLFEKEILIGIFVFCIVGFVLYYGKKLKIEVEKSEREIFHQKQELENLKNAVDMHSIVAKTDINGSITYVNDKFCEISKYSREELIGRNHNIVNSGFHPKEFFKEMWELILSGKTWRGIVKNQAKDGNFYWVDTTITPIKNKMNEIEEFIAIRYDITDQVDLRVLSDSIQVIAKIGAWELDVNTFEVKWTDEVYRIHGLDVGSQVSVADSINFYALDYRDKISSYVEECIANGTPYDDEFEFISAKNENLWVRAIGEPIYDKNGNVTKLCGTFQDITAIKRAELVAEEQRKIALHSSKLASIGELAAGVGHEINNPLMILSGYVSAMSKSVEANNYSEESLTKHTEKIKIALNRIAEIVKGLRSFSRKDGDDFEVFDLRESIEESYKLVKDIFNLDSVKISLDISDDIEEMPLFGNRGKIQQVLTNIIANARDATKGKQERTIDIQVSLSSDMYELTISDNGHGIPAHLKTKIFDPFFTTKKLNEGTGIGLSIVHSMILEHNGEITFDSVEGEKTSFIIRLPIFNSPTVSNEISLNEHKNDLVSFKGLRVLSVDDEEDVREIIQDLLQGYEIKVDCAIDGSDAFEIYKKNPEAYDVILSDIQMPNVNGTDLLVKVRGEKKIKQPYFVFLTGGVNLDLNEFKNLYDDMLFKPINESELKDTLVKIYQDIYPEKKQEAV